MNLVFFAHPDFVGHKSMPRFARMLSNGMAERGHSVDVWFPLPVLSKLSQNLFIKKWLGYVDQYVIFPRRLRKLLKQVPADTLFIFTDQALGPWVPLVTDRPHVIHCHDFIALQSALGEIPENRTGWTGTQYQKLIRRGFSAGKNFISVSNKTRLDLHRFLPAPPAISEVVYNGLHRAFYPENLVTARNAFSKRTNTDLNSGYVLHVGGNIWYKNKLGVIEIYDAWRAISKVSLPLVLIGEPLSEELVARIKQSPFKKDIQVYTGIEDDYIGFAYSGATVMLFPSFDEGFGWPIAEAMAAGTLVMTTGEAPMSEVAGTAGFLIERRPGPGKDGQQWALKSAIVLDRIVNLSTEERKNHIATSVANASRFNTANALDKIESIYQRIAREG